MRTDRGHHPAIQAGRRQNNLEALSIGRLMVSEVTEHGGPAAINAVYRGSVYRLNVPRLKLEMLVSSDRADEVIEALTRVARTKPARRRRHDSGL